MKNPLDEFPENLPAARFVLDSRGRIIVVEKSIINLTGWQPEKVKGMYLVDFICPVHGQSLRDLKNLLLKWDEQNIKTRETFCELGRFPRDPKYVVKAEICITAKYTGKTKYLYGIIFGTNAPTGYKKAFSISRNSDDGIALLDNKNRILNCNYNFLEFANIFSQEVVGTPLNRFIEPQFFKEEYLSGRQAAAYLAGVAMNNQHPWKEKYSIRGKKPNRFFRDWVLSPNTTCSFQNSMLNLKNELQNAYAVLNLPVNLPNTDLKIEYECSSPDPNDLSCIIGGHMLFHYPDENGYFFGFGCSGRENEFQRKQIVLMRNKKLIPKPNKWYRCVMERSGGRFLFSVNGKLIFNYIDIHPVFRKTTQYFSFYFCSHAAKLKNVAVYTRETNLVFEKLSRISRHHIAFRNNPGMIFKMWWTWGYWQEGLAKLVYFQDISGYVNVDIINKRKSPAPKHKQLQKAGEYITENYNKRINFAELAKNFYMSYRNFVRTFKKDFGTTPRLFQIETRLKRAKTMLASGQYKVWEVSQLLGYNDPVDFYQIFRKYEGIAPSGFLNKYGF
ncbi:MAG: helix-turn-helix domain-containing protein [bacterium]